MAFFPLLSSSLIILFFCKGEIPDLVYKLSSIVIPFLSPLQQLYLGAQGGVFSKVVLGLKTWHEALSNKNMSIPHPQKIGDPPYPPHFAIFGRTKGGIFKSCPRKTSGKTYEGCGRCLKATL